MRKISRNKARTGNQGTTWITCRRCGAKAAGFVVYKGSQICIACYNALCAGGK